MSLRTTRGLLFASSMALGIVAIGCGDDDKPTKGETDEMDGGAGDAGKADASKPDGTVMANGDMMCGTEMCTGVSLAGTPVSACCTPAGGCGLNADDIKKLNAQSQFTGCIPKDVPAASASTHCGAFFDQVEPDPAGDADAIAKAHSNGGLDVAGSIPLVFDGCCLPSGECGAMLSEPRGVAGVNLHFGCVSLTSLQSSLGGGMSSRPAPTLAPFCNPTAGALEAGAPACPAKMGPILCDRLKALLPSCDPAMDTPDWVCQTINLPKISDGKVPTVSTCMAGVPEFVNGCGVGVNKAGCVPNVAANVFGCENFTGAAVPVTSKLACGCGDGKVGERCIPNVPANVCGALEPAAADFANIPKQLCGCGAGVLSGGRPCLNNVPKESCGTLDVPSTAVTFLPKSLCGCGETVTWDAATMASTPCLSKTPQTSCGGGDIPKGTVADPTANCYSNVKAYAHGCGVGVVAQGCIPNGETTIFGCDQPAAGANATPYPKYACGCGVGTYTGSCIPNVAANVCGGSDPTADQLAGFQPYVCGCGAGVYRAGVPCLSNVARTTCGTQTLNSAAITATFSDAVCGCDADTSDSTVVTWDPVASPLPCLSTLATTVCGNRVVCQDAGACSGATCCATGQTCIDANGSGDGDFCQ